jgi:hypothetical protein
MKMWIHLNFIILCIALAKGKVEDECGAGEMCVRLCCEVNAKDSECYDLTLLPEERKFRNDFKVVKGRPCDDKMMVDEDDWEFSSVSEFFPCQRESTS